MHGETLLFLCWAESNIRRISLFETDGCNSASVTAKNGCTLATTRPCDSDVRPNTTRKSRQISRVQQTRPVRSRRWPKSFLATLARVHSSHGVSMRTRCRVRMIAVEKQKSKNRGQKYFSCLLGFRLDCNERSDYCHDPCTPKNMCLGSFVPCWAEIIC